MAESDENAPSVFALLQDDFKNLLNECKKRFPQLKEACEDAINKLKCTPDSTPPWPVINQVLFPIQQALDTNDTKVQRVALSIVQRIITEQLVDKKAAWTICQMFWSMYKGPGSLQPYMEVKILQLASLLLTSNSVVQNDALARTLVLCFRLHTHGNATTMNTAGATIRQLVCQVFERVVDEDAGIDTSLIHADTSSQTVDMNVTPREPRINWKVARRTPPPSLKPAASDAFMLFQDLIQLVNGDAPRWLHEVTEMTKPFGLELLESVQGKFWMVFHEHPEFRFLLKERVCALVIKLFPPNNQRPSAAVMAVEKPNYPISVRLLRMVSVFVEKHHDLLVTECEIYLTVIVKFLDPEKPTWNRALALEMLHKIFTQPPLVGWICDHYDRKDGTTNIFQKIVSAIGAYIQSFKLNVATSGNESPIGVHNRGFVVKGVFYPIASTFPPGRTKSTYLDMLDKTDVPVIPRGYGISMAYACLMDIVRSIWHLVLRKRMPDDPPWQEEYKYRANDNERALHEQLITSSAHGLLIALTPLIETCKDTYTTESILQAMRLYAALCGHLKMRTQCDAFITALCRASLPPNYPLPVLDLSQYALHVEGNSRSNSPDLNVQCFTAFARTNREYRSHIMAMNTPLTTSLTSPLDTTAMFPVALTSRDVHCMRALMLLATDHGNVLESAWHIVLSTLQHLVWILGLKPSTGGSLTATKATLHPFGANPLIMLDPPSLSRMLTAVFESSKDLTNDSLMHLLDALWKLSDEAMGLASLNKEPSLFAVAKLLETGLANFDRVQVWWKPFTNHLLTVCNHQHIRMREWGVEAITYLIKAALQHRYTPPLKQNPELQVLLIGPLAELSSISQGDVRHRQLDCVLQILQSGVESLNEACPIILEIIGAIDNHPGEAFIRSAFQCLQLIVADYLSVMSWTCLPQCIDTVSRFGFQTEQVNISFTAVGFMWNISDYLYLHRAELMECNDPVLPDIPGITDLTNFVKLYMCVYMNLGKLCVDPRPSVRKSASLTLFSTISNHSAIFTNNTWATILFKVLFPLLVNVSENLKSASSEKYDMEILVHHSRNTAHKQWAETQGLTLTGVARVFSTKWNTLTALDDFQLAWKRLLHFIERSALSENDEVSLNALKMFQEILHSNSVPVTNDADGETTHQRNSELDVMVWDSCWRIWLSIANTRIVPYVQGPEAHVMDGVITSQTYLTTFVQLFVTIYVHVNDRFTQQNLMDLCKVLIGCINVPIHNDSTPFAQFNANNLIAPLHTNILTCMDLIMNNVLARNQTQMFPLVFIELLDFSALMCKQLTIIEQSTEGTSQVLKSNEYKAYLFTSFGEKALKMAMKLYEKTSWKTVVHDEALISYKFVNVLHEPLRLKYKCPTDHIWKLSASCLIKILKGVFSGLEWGVEHSLSLYTAISETLDDYLFPNARPSPDRGIDELVYDEAVDCQMIEVLRQDLLPHSNQVPRSFILSIMIILNKGSIHTRGDKSELDLSVREDFARACFEALVNFSICNHVDPMVESLDESPATLSESLAIVTLLKRFKDVVRRFNSDELLSGKCPLPRYRMSEIAFVLEAISMVIKMMKKYTDCINQTAWDKLIELYPHLVACTATPTAQVLKPLREVLNEYKDMLQPPLRFLPPEDFEDYEN